MVGLETIRKNSAVVVIEVMLVKGWIGRGVLLQYIEVRYTKCVIWSKRRTEV